MDTGTIKFIVCLAICVTHIHPTNGYSDEEKRTGIVHGKYLAQLEDGHTAADLASGKGMLYIQNIREYRVGKISIVAFEMEDDYVSALELHPSVKHLEHNGLVQLVEPVQILTTKKVTQHRQHKMSESGYREGCQYQDLVTDFDNYGTWGLIRTSHWNPPDFHSKPYLWDYDGKGVLAYVLDSGIELNHTEFEGRAIHGMHAAEFADEGMTDYHGHGTHVASTVAGTIYGMAKKATMVNVKVLGADNWGLLESVIEGVQWVTYDVLRRKLQGTRVKAIINMSLQYAWHSHIFFNAVQESVDVGVTNLVAAGNLASDSSVFAPAAFSNTVTIGAIQRENDQMAAFSNFGPGVDICGPGVLVTGAWSKHSEWCEGQEDNECLIAVSGTSMATPHVAGAVARYLSSIPDEEYDAMDPKDIPEHVRQMLIEKSGKGFLHFINENQKTTPNRYLYLGCGEVPDDQTTTTTVATPPPDENGAGAISKGTAVLPLMMACIMFY